MFLHIILITFKNLGFHFITIVILLIYQKYVLLTKFKSERRVVFNSDFYIMVTSYKALNYERILIIYKKDGGK